MNSLINYKQIITATSVLLAIMSCGHSNPDIKGRNDKPVRVKELTARIAEGAEGDNYSGTIEAGASTIPSFLTAGTITSINVKEGDRVSKGQLIASIDGESLAHAYEIAQATLREAQDAYNRMKKLHDANALPDMQWVSVQEQLKQAQAAAEIAHKGKSNANLYSPISGIVAHKLADVGQATAPGIPIMEIMDTGTMKVKISVPESDLQKMKHGEKAIVKANGKTYTATLSDKGVAANTLSRNYDIKFRINDPDENLLPGMICSLSIEGITPAGISSSEGIILPPQAVSLDWDNNSYVWVNDKGTARRKKVEIGGLDAKGIIINCGLNSSDKIIVEGQQKLSNGIKVVTIN